MTELGHPDRYGKFLDELCPAVRPATIAELEQAVHHWRAAGWSDLAIGAVIALSDRKLVRRDLYVVRALRGTV